MGSIQIKIIQNQNNDQIIKKVKMAKLEDNNNKTNP